MTTEARHLRTLLSESAVYSVAGVISRILMFLLVPVFTRVLAPEDFGAVGLVNTTVALVSVFAILGLDSAAGRWFWDSDDEGDRRRTISTWFGAYLATSIVLAAAMLAASGWLGSLTVPSDGAEVVRLAALTIPLAVTGVVVNNLLRMQRRPWAACAYALVTSLVWLGTSIWFVAGLDLGVAGVYRAQVVAGVVATILGLVLLRGWISPRLFASSRLRAMLRYALPLVPAAVAFWVVNLSDRYFLKAYTDSAQVGLYQVANAIAALVGLLTVGFQQAWGPFALSIHREPNAKATYAKALPLYTLAACLIATAVSVAAPEVIRIVAGSAYEAAAPAVPWLAFAYVVLGANYIAGLGASLTKTTKPVAVSVAWAAVANVALNLLLIPRLGGPGAAIATLGGWSVMVAYLFVRSHALHPIPYPFVRASAFFAIGLAVGLLGAAWHPTSLAAAIGGKAAMVLLLIPVAFALGVVRPQQVRSILRGAAR